MTTLVCEDDLGGPGRFSRSDSQTLEFSVALFNEDDSEEDRDIFHNESSAVIARDGVKNQDSRALHIRLSIDLELGLRSEEFRVEIYTPTTSIFAARMLTNDDDDEGSSVPASSNPLSCLPIRRAGEVYGDLTTNEYAEIIKTWLQHCLFHHRLCQDYASIRRPKPLPKRVLDLSENKISLIETAGTNDLYIALSHCWGRQQIITTTKDSMDSRTEGINIEDMPQTFQDAVQLTRALGIRYLWVDSLCIIQDDIEDWSSQSAVMSDLYAGCYLNIAATRSSSGSEPFLCTRWTIRNSLERSMGMHGKPLTQIRKCNVQSYAVSGSNSFPWYGRDMRVRLALNSSHEALRTLRWTHLHKDTTPLNQRAWVYQERNLSARTVHFHANEMVWDCADQQLCECHAINTEKPGGDGWSASKNRILNLGSLGVPGSQELHGLWRTIVEDYCLMNLTHHSDRLPALSGLAKKLSEHMPDGDEYLAGLWKGNLARDLLWSVAERQTPLKCRDFSSKDFVPPSWSWASIIHSSEGPRIKWEYETKPKLAKWAETWSYKQDPRFHILDVQCSLIGNNKYGRVSGGRITATGAMCAISVSDYAKLTDQALISGMPEIVTDRWEEFNSLHLHYDDPRDGEDIRKPDSSTKGFVFCLFIGTFTRHFDDDREDHHEHRGLILKPSTTAAGTWQRTGSFTQYIEYWVHNDRAFLEKAMVVTVDII